jgi:hypothetical protein
VHAASLGGRVSQDEARGSTLLPRRSFFRCGPGLCLRDEAMIDFGHAKEKVCAEEIQQKETSAREDKQEDGRSS